MTDAQVLNVWLIGLGVAVVVVVIAATLLLMVLSAAKSIERGASAALGMVQHIRKNTQVIWALQDTNQVALKLIGGANAILRDAGEIAQALHDADVRRGRAR